MAIAGVFTYSLLDLDKKNNFIVQKFTNLSNYIANYQQDLIQHQSSINNDYIEVTTRLNNARVAREAEYRQYLQQRDVERAQILQREAEANLIINRIELPIIRTDEVAADDCPICMETLGETNKSVLRCGHSLCTSCLLTQTLRGVTLKSTSSCFCTVCRAPYL